MFSYETPGIVISLGSPSLSFSIKYNFSREFSWVVDGVFQKFLESSWNTGDGIYYWYRVQGICGKMECDEFGVQYPKCNNMTFFTVAPARNLSELCEILSSPRINAPVRLRISSVQRYSRPVAKDQIVDGECNILEEQEICQIPECFDYCVDQDVNENIRFNMIAVDTIYSHSMSGGFSLFGLGDTPSKKTYNPVFPIVLFSGQASTLLTLVFSKPSSIQVRSSNLEFISSSRFFATTGSVNVSGSFFAISPFRNYFPSGSVGVLGGIGSKELFFICTGGLSVSGHAEVSLNNTFIHSAFISVSGQVQDCISPSRFFASESGFHVSGESERKFEHLGTFNESINLSMTAFDLKSETSELPAYNDLTINSGTVSACGCSSIGLSLVARHNLSNSSAFANFLRRSAVLQSNQFKMGYRSSDSSWRGSQKFFAKGFPEEWTLSFSMTCINQIWKFKFSVRAINGNTRKIVESKFIVDTPSYVVCDDNNIGTSIRLNVGYEYLNLQRGLQVPVVERTRASSSSSMANATSRQLEISTDGFANEYVVYYDNLGLFKDSYWNSFPFEILINPSSKVGMPFINLDRIFK